MSRNLESRIEKLEASMTNSKRVALLAWLQPGEGAKELREKIQAAAVRYDVLARNVAVLVWGMP